jgi:hypothetical protein
MRHKKLLSIQENCTSQKVCKENKHIPIKDTDLTEQLKNIVPKYIPANTSFVICIGSLAQTIKEFK